MQDKKQDEIQEENTDMWLDVLQYKAQNMDKIQKWMVVVENLVYKNVEAEIVWKNNR